MGSDFDGDLEGVLGVKTLPETLRGRTQPTLFYDLATVGVDQAQMAVFVTEIQPGCNLWSLPATIRHGPIPPSVEPIWSSYILQTLTQGTARGIGLLISSSE